MIKTYRGRQKYRQSVLLEIYCTLGMFYQIKCTIAMSFSWEISENPE